MNVLKKIGQQLGRFALWADRVLNWSLGRREEVWSDYGGNTNETISLTLGAEEAKTMWVLYQDIGEKVYDLTDIEIDSEHILGEPSSDLCDSFEPYHALKCINRNWKSETGKKLLLECPGADSMVATFLKRRGVKI